MAAFNSEKSIERSLISLEQQDYDNIELIVVDGASTDGTIEIVNKYSHIVDIFVCEEDAGLYYALNTGIKLATGDVIGFLHSDDIFAGPHVISAVMDEFIFYDVNCVYGDCSFVNPRESYRTTRYWRAGLATKHKIRLGWMPPHTATFFLRSQYENNGDFNTIFKISADYELLLRFFLSPGINFSYLRKNLIIMNTGGLSNNGTKNSVKKYLEDVNACKLNNMNGYTVSILKRLQKIVQFKLF